LLEERSGRSEDFDTVRSAPTALERIALS